MAKKYSINVDDSKITSVEVDGTRYKNADKIPDPEDRARMRLLAESFSGLELMKPSSQSFFVEKMIVPLFLVVAVLMLVIAAIAGINTGRALAREESAPGYVVDIAVREDQDGSQYYYPVVEYYLPDKSTRTVQTSEGSWPPAHKVGDAITVLYDPEQPLSARIRSTSGTILQWALTIILGGLGLAFFAATIFARWVLKKDQPRS